MVDLVIFRVLFKLIADARSSEFSCSPQRFGQYGMIRGFLERLAVFGRSTRAVAVSNPLRDLVVPFFLGSSVEKTYDDHGHIVTADSAGFAVGSEAVVHHVFTDPVKILLGRDTTANEFHHSLGRLAVPDACIDQWLRRSAKPLS